jgi:cholesterol transport system auxiliary component
MRHLFILIIAVVLAGCLGGGKPKPSPAIYDFGLDSASDKSSLPESRLPLDEISANPSLDSDHMRYRLAYQNPAQVFTYAESRWVAPPAELLSHKLRAMSGAAAPTQQNCILQLKLEAFDHVFESKTASHGVVQISAALLASKTHQVILRKQIEQSVAANSQDAQGGVAALNTASTEALTQALQWGNEAAEASTFCK